jgi:hypothetical protein
MGLRNPIIFRPRILLRVDNTRPETETKRVISACSVASYSEMPTPSAPVMACSWSAINLGRSALGVAVAQAIEKSLMACRCAARSSIACWACRCASICPCKDWFACSRFKTRLKALIMIGAMIRGITIASMVAYMKILGLYLPPSNQTKKEFKPVVMRTASRMAIPVNIQVLVSRMCFWILSRIYIHSKLFLRFAVLASV